MRGVKRIDWSEVKREMKGLAKETLETVGNREETQKRKLMRENFGFAD